MIHKRSKNQKYNQLKREFKVTQKPKASHVQEKSKNVLLTEFDRDIFFFFYEESIIN